MLRIGICEDNPTHLKHIKAIVMEHLKGNCQIDSFKNAEDFRLRSISKGCPYEIILMDIELKNDSGIQLAQEINKTNSNTHIIFITQYMQYASNVYDAEHIYFVMKASMNQYLPKALDKTINKIEYLNHLFLTITWNRTDFELLQKDILYMERILRKTTVYTVDKTYQTSEKLTGLLKRLSPAFAVCHRSFIVNFMMVNSIEKDHALLINHAKIPISRTYYKNTKKDFLMFLSS